MKTLVTLCIIMGSIGGYWYISHTYTFVQDYTASVTVAGVEEIGKVTYRRGDSVWGYESDEGLKIRIGKHLQTSEEQSPDSSYQEYILVPYEYVTKYTLF